MSARGHPQRGAPGVRDTGVAHVAMSAGMGRSSLYHYCADKNPDQNALLSDMVGKMLEQERKVDAG